MARHRQQLMQGFAASRRQRPTAGMLVTQPPGIAKGTALGSIGGKPTNFVQPGFAQGVGLAKGWGIQYGDDAKAQSFVRTPTPAAPSLAGAGGAVAAPAAPAAPRAPADPRDSTYASNIGQALFNRAQGLGELDAADVNDRNENASYMTQLARQQVQSRENTTESANKQGLFYSGILGKKLGEVDQGYTDQRTSAASRLAAAMGARSTQRKNLIKRYGDPSQDGDYGTYGAEELGAAGERHLGDPVAPENLVDEGVDDPGGAPDVGFAKGVSLGAGWRVRRDPVTGRAIGLIPPGGQ